MTVCIYCLACLVFGEQLQLRKMSNEEFGELDPEAIAAVVEARNAIRVAQLRLGRSKPG